MKKITLLLLLLFVFTKTICASSNDSYDGTIWQVNYSDGEQILLKLSLNKRAFSLYSRKGSTRDILGPKAALGNIIGKVNAHTIEIKGDYLLKNDTLFLEGVYESLTSKQKFEGIIFNSKFEGTLEAFSMTGEQTDSFKPLDDYYELTKMAIDTVERYLFNPEILKSKKWNNIKKKTLKISQKVVDDYEYKTLFNFYGRQLPFTHFGMLPSYSSRSSSSNTPKKKVSKFSIKEINKNTVLFDVNSFSASADEINPYIDTLKSMQFDNLIIDLRDNYGGSVSSAMPLARYLVKEKLYGGVFLTKKYFDQHTELPQIEDYNSFKEFSEASFSMIISGIRNHEGLCLTVRPDEQTFDGNIYVLTNGNTASTCEPLVYGLKHAKRAVIIGEITAGQMLNGEKFTMNSKYDLFLPTADYYTVDGAKIDKIGVTPHIETASKDALKRVLEIIN
ncbi:S41 family peptidase [Aureibacter tunicatorum]|uniref:Tail specific protease domain-containing protein n=1 Tax=Aureibacter tunicatorum TaxID=866807 RepID=A0AAE3XHP9_9BACT|nr:S41 family peptidase [Aureibacter tunicatorum]MDR6237906.1 hypothetical protein [Aureibacter tunicatorum]BDD02939.1 hypothetical protein AUTU_04220 [Aureibacter tunicatorum]